MTLVVFVLERKKAKIHITSEWDLDEGFDSIQNRLSAATH